MGAMGSGVDGVANGLLALGGVHEQIVGSALEGLDQGDPLATKVAREFVAAYLVALSKEVPDQKIVHKVASRESVNAITAYHRAILNRALAHARASAAEQALEAAQKRVRQTILEHEDVQGDSDWALDAVHLALVRSGLPSDKAKAYAELYVIAKDLVTNARLDELCTITAKGIPETMMGAAKKAGSGMDKFLVDLATYLYERGRKERKFAQSICEDTRVAVRAARNEQLPAPIQTLAMFAVIIAAHNPMQQSAYRGGLRA